MFIDFSRDCPQQTNDLCTDICDLSPAYPPELAKVSLANRIACDKLTFQR